MKKIIFLLTFAIVAGFYKNADAQVGISVNIGSQPVWGPVGYDYAEYYYFPEIDVYYHVPDRQFVFFDRGAWISNYSLPPYYRNFDLYHAYKVVINEARPYARNDYWHSRYYSYRGRQQEIIYNSREPKYFVINEHPQHSRWMASRQDNDRGYNKRNELYGRPDINRNDNRNDNRTYNTRRPGDVVVNNREENNRYRNDNNAANNNNRRWNQNNQRNNEDGRYYGNRRN